MKKILIVTAMEEELESLILYFKPLKYELKDALFPVYKLQIEQKKVDYLEVIFTNTGIGKVNASYSMTNLIKEERPDLVVNLGTAGGVAKGLQILDLVVADKLAYHDVDVTPFGYQKGQVPGQEQYIDVLGVENHQKLAFGKIETQVGTILSGDQFLNNKDKTLEIIATFDNPYAVEMESTAIADICQKLATKILIVRGISDLAHGDSTMEFDKYLTKVAKKFVDLIQYIVDNYQEFV